MSLLLIDGDILIHRAAFAAERTKYLVTQDTPDGAGMRVAGYFDDAKSAKEYNEVTKGDVWSRKEVQPEDQAILIFNTMLKDIKDHYASENLEVRIYISPSVGNFREQLATRAKYKANRDHVARPKHLGACRNRATELGARVATGAEADDYIAIDATANPGSVIASIDKDMLQVTGRHYNFVKKEEVTVSKRQADLNFWTQVITGDSTDNVPGVEGYGPVKAAKVLDGAKGNLDCWNRILDLYKQVYKADGEKFAKECASLVYVLRRQGVMWEPPRAA